MMIPYALKNFRAYGLAVEFYRECKQVKLSPSLRDQLTRARLACGSAGIEGIGHLSGNGQSDLATVQALIRASVASTDIGIRAG